MNAIELQIAGVKLLEELSASDFRGEFEVFWESGEFFAAGISFVPVSACHSYNEKPWTLRGMHFQRAPHDQAKLVSCVRGAVSDVVVDLRCDSPTYLRWVSAELTEASGQALYIPHGCAHGFLTMQDHTTVAYLIEGDYCPEATGTLRWNDPAVGIEWPTRDPILSERDRMAPDFQP